MVVTRESFKPNVQDFYKDVHIWFSFYQFLSNTLIVTVLAGGAISLGFGLFGDSKTKFWLFEPKIWAGAGGVLVVVGNTAKDVFKIQDNAEYYRYFDSATDVILRKIDNADGNELTELKDRYNKLLDLKLLSPDQFKNRD